MATLETKSPEKPDFATERGKSSFVGDRPKPDKGGTGISASRAGEFGTGSTVQKKPLIAQLQAGAQSLNKVKVKQTELIIFTTQLSVMLDSGVVLSDALDVIAEQCEQGPFKLIVADIADTVKDGENFSKALADYPRVFNSMFISMVRASEASGRMPEMLRVLSGYLDFEAETRKRIKGALTYPFIMAAMAIVATLIMMFLVLPRFMKIYEIRGAALPGITQALVDLVNIMQDPYMMTLILTMVILASAALYYWLGTRTGRQAKDFVKIHTPVLGTMFIDTVVTRSMRIMATMVNTGVSLLDTIEVIRGSCRNYYFEQLWADTDKKIRDGYQLSESIQVSICSRLIAPGILQMIRAGEKSGRLGEVSDKISVFYEKKLHASIKSVTALIEPMMIIILGGIIGTIAIALLLPIFKISSIISH
jgi:type IV pilus assembly protein PilC